MDNFIHRPEEFFRKLHPYSTKGRIVLERQIKRTKYHSQVTASDAEKLFRIAYQFPDIYYSVASFSGMPLLINFENTKCLYLRFWWSHKEKYKIDCAIKFKCFPQPTAVISDGEKLTYCWILKNTITNTEFYKVYLLQHALNQMFEELKPCKESLDISSVIPLIGTINTRSSGFVSLISYNGGNVLDNDTAERLLLGRYHFSEREKIVRHSNAVLELRKLIDTRFMTTGSNATEDWLLFFGASLLYFCTKEQLAKELMAISISLEGQKWKNIKEKFEPLITSIASTAHTGCMIHQGRSISFDSPDWFSLVAGKLNVTNDEVRKLGLQVIMIDRPLSIYSEVTTLVLRPLGEADFIPVERLMIKLAA